MALPVTQDMVTQFCAATEQIKDVINSIPQLFTQQEEYLAALAPLNNDESHQLEDQLMDCRNSLSEAITALCAPPAENNHIGGKRRKSHRRRAHRRRTHRRTHH